MASVIFGAATGVEPARPAAAVKLEVRVVAWQPALDGGGASAAARLFLLRPLQVLIATAGNLAHGAVGNIWAGFIALVGGFARAIRRELKELLADVRWIVRGFHR